MRVKVWLLQETTEYFEAEIEIENQHQLPGALGELKERMAIDKPKPKEVRKGVLRHYRTKVIQLPVFTVPVTYQVEGLFKIPADNAEAAEATALLMYQDGKPFDSVGDYSDLIRVGNAYLDVENSHK